MNELHEEYRRDDDESPFPCRDPGVPVLQG